MSSTKIVIIVLVLIGVLFVIFVVRGAIRNDPPPPDNANREAHAQKQQPPAWAKKIEGLFSSLKPKRALEKKKYSLNDQPAQETIQADLKQPFRTVRFHLLGGRTNVEYEPPEGTTVDKELEDLKDQNCELPGKFDPDNPKADLSRCSIVALKQGGKVTITCQKTFSPCQVEVE